MTRRKTIKNKKLDNKKTILLLQLIKRKNYLIIASITFVVAFSLLFLSTKVELSKVISSQTNKILSTNNCFSCNKSFYDPYLLSQRIKDKDESIVIVDIRSQNEYIDGHIKSAVNIPVYTSLDSIEKTERSKAEIFKDFVKLRNKHIIIYGSSSTSSMPKLVQEILNEYKIKATVLSVGWNEWYHFRNTWVPEGKWATFDPDSFSVLGESPR